MSESEKKEEATEPTYQQNLVMDRLCELFAAIHDGNSTNDRRAEKIATVAGGIVAFMGGASALQSGNASPLAMVALVSVFVFSIAVFHQCAKVWGPSMTHYPTVPDIDILYDKYIAKGVCDAYNRYFTSIVECINQNRKVNDEKADANERAMYLLQFQVIAVAVALVFKALEW